VDEDIIRTLWWRLLIDGDRLHDEMLDIIDAYLTPDHLARLRELVEDPPAS
jgi:hypothetical protein